MKKYDGREKNMVNEELNSLLPDIYIEYIFFHRMCMRYAHIVHIYSISKINQVYIFICISILTSYIIYITHFIPFFSILSMSETILMWIGNIICTIFTIHSILLYSRSYVSRNPFNLILGVVCHQ